MRLLKKIISKLNSTIFNNQRRWEEAYLSQSVDHVDLERRIKQLDRRQIEVGPFGSRVKSCRYQEGIGTMLIIKRLLNWCEMIGYTRAVAELSRQGFHAEAKALMLEKTKLQGIRERALVRLETKKRFKANYDPAKHYMRGKPVATWSGKKGMVA